ncbi:MAG: signal peptide peptidase SppA [Planctomycetaceae bacterium]|nr:signal peptide peptidase SppA [Planctomycetaceae bacterium]
MTEHASSSGAAPTQTIVIREAPRRSWFAILLLFLLAISLFFNVGQLGALLLALSGDVNEPGEPIEVHYSGDRLADAKIALVDVSGTIMPPFTERILDTLDHIEKDKSIRGIVLVVDSPGGLVADSHQIYHKLKEVRTKRNLPVYVSMGRMAASGGYYVAMGAGPDGKIYAEPTTWTGSIGVIIPHYDVSKLAGEFGVRAEPLTTGPLKDTLNPFREMRDDERAVWGAIMDDAFVRFQEVILDGREKQLDAEQVKSLATGQVYTAKQAEQNKLIDVIGYLDTAIDDLKTSLKLTKVHVVRYEHPLSLTEVLLGSAQARQPSDPLRELLDASVPRAMYFCGWHAGVE